MKFKIRHLKLKTQKGFSLAELMTAVAISTIVTLAVSVTLVDNQKAWNTMYGNINSEVAVESLTACKRFDAVVRQSCSSNFSIDPACNWVEVYYYSAPGAKDPDRYAKFNWQGSQVTYEWGSLDPKTTLGIQTICHNVTACRFRAIGNSIQMLITLNDNTRAVTTASSNVMNNN
jgi:prepilin-type N-terminal cleavage/methylation domain-containing protein